MEQRGAILDKMRHCEAETTDTSCVMVEAFSVFCFFYKWIGIVLLVFLGLRFTKVFWIYFNIP